MLELDANFVRDLNFFYSILKKINIYVGDALMNISGCSDCRLDDIKLCKYKGMCKLLHYRGKHFQNFKAFSFPAIYERNEPDDRVCKIPL